MSNKENIIEEVTEKPYTLRKLKDKDLYPVLDIVTAVLPDDLANVFAEVATGQKTVNEVGSIAVYKIVISILRNIGTVHNEVYTLLSDVSGIPAEEIEEMEFGTTPMMIWDIVADAKNASFFKVLSKLL